MAPLTYPLSASVANDIDTAVSSIVYKLTRQELL